MSSGLSRFNCVRIQSGVLINWIVRYSHANTGAAAVERQESRSTPELNRTKMKLLPVFAFSGLASSVVARSPQYSGKNIELPKPRFQYPPNRNAKRSAYPVIPQNEKTASEELPTRKLNII